MKLGCVSRFIIVFIVVFFIVYYGNKAFAQEAEVPPPILNLEYSERYTFQEYETFDAPNDTSYDYNIYNPEQDPIEIRRDVMRSDIVRNFNGCLFSPIPIDDRYFGCKFNFEPREVRAHLR